MIASAHRTIVAAAATMLALTIPAAHAQVAYTDKKKAEIGAVVKDYLVKNPELIQEALAELEKRQQLAEKAAAKKALSQVSELLVASPRATVIGNPKGDVTLVEFFDYNCGYCKRSIGDIAEMIKADPKLRVVIRDFPVLGPDSMEASLVAIAAKQQIKPERFFEFHQKLMDGKGRVGKERAIAIAKDFGADPARLAKDMESPEVRKTVEETLQIADALKLQGTPAFVVGDEIIFGAVGAEPLKRAVAATRKCGQATC